MFSVTDTLKKFIQKSSRLDTLAKSFYYSLPPRLRFSRHFWTQLSFLEESETWDKDRLETYQIEELKKFITHAYHHTRYYKTLFDEHGIKPNDIQDVSDLKHIPLLSKEDVRDNFEQLRARNVNSNKVRRQSTGGSTGIPVTFLTDAKREAREWAFIYTIWKRVGLRPKSRMAIIRGSAVPDPNKVPFIRYGPLLHIAPSRLTPDGLPSILEELRKFKPDYLRLYPSTGTIISEYMIEHALPPIESLKAVLCGSEMLLDSQRASIEKAFHTKVFSWYGASEKVVLAGECESSRMYHIFPEYGVTEIVARENGEGEIVGTGFLNYLFPLIRYCTQDKGTIDFSSTCSQCGRRYPLLREVQGRLSEFIIDKTHNRIPLITFNLHNDSYSHLYAFQVYQDRPGKVIYRVSPKTTFDEEQEENLYRSLKRKLGDKTDIVIEKREHLEMTASGKIPIMIQKISPSETLS